MKGIVVAAIGIALSAATAVATDTPDDRAALAALVAAYPDHLAAIDGGALVWRDGTRMPVDDGETAKPFARWLEAPDIKDMQRQRYPAGAPATQPEPDFDPGRARNRVLFDKMYGDCTRKNVATRLVDVVWLPKKWGRRLRVTKVNGVDKALAAVSAALDALPAAFDVHLKPPAGTYDCRPIAGTGRTSAHGYGIAIDLATAGAHYWRWSKPVPGRPLVYRNTMPAEIVAIFEQHGFIWGGRWYHYDTMHFEYRPELLPARMPTPRPSPPAP